MGTYFRNAYDAIIEESCCKKIIVQAGGKGTRLEGLTRNKPKCLVPVNNLPIYC